MKKMLFGMLASVAMVAIPATANASELVNNGGFETGDFTGWTQFDNTSFTGVETGSPHSGDFNAYFGPVGSTGGIKQLLNTVAGQTYNISVWAKNSEGTPNFGSISFNGVVLGSLVDAPAFDWTNYTFSGLATSSQTELSFAFRHDPSYFRLDDVSVTGLAGGVPEPATWGLMILGFGAVGGAMRRRSATKATVRFA